MRNLTQYFILNIIKLGIKSFPTSTFPCSQVPFVICSHVPSGRLLYNNSHGRLRGWRASFTHDFPLRPEADGHKQKINSPCYWWCLPFRAHMCCLLSLLFTWVYKLPLKNTTWNLTRSSILKRSSLWSTVFFLGCLPKSICSRKTGSSEYTLRTKTEGLWKRNMRSTLTITMVTTFSETKKKRWFIVWKTFLYSIQWRPREK